MAGRVFVRYAALHGIQYELPFHSWDAHHQDAAGHLVEAMERANDAVAHYAAADDVINVLCSLDSQAERWAQWAFAAELLIERAASVSTLALDDVHQARHVVALEFFDAWTILHRVRDRLVATRKEALSMLGTFRLIGTTGMEAFGLINDSRSKFAEHFELLSSVRQGMLVDVAIHNFADPVPEEVLLATVIVDIAHREISQAAIPHAKTHHIFVRCGAYLHIQDGMAYRSWESHHQDAVGYFDEALGRARDAVSCFQVARDAVSMIRVLPYRCPLWEGWALEAQTFRVVATVYASMAMGEVRRERQAISLEFDDAWTILRQRR